jgi:hypothetical protein
VANEFWRWFAALTKPEGRNIIPNHGRISHGADQKVLHECQFLARCGRLDDSAPGSYSRKHRIRQADWRSPYLPVRRLVLSYPADRPMPRLARFAGETITTIVNDYVESGIWVGQLLNGK